MATCRGPRRTRMHMPSCPATSVTAALILALSLCRVGVASPGMCQFGGSSDIAPIGDDDGGFDVPTDCISSDAIMLPFLDDRFPEGRKCQDFESRCVTAVYKVDVDFVDQTGLGCVPNDVSDAELKSVLELGGFLGGQVDSISNCTTDECNQCLAAVNESGWFWHTMAGKAAIGATMLLLAAVGLWVYGCVRAHRCVGCWAVPRVLRGPPRDLGLLSETTPLVDEPVPPPYFEAPPAHPGTAQPTVDAPTYEAMSTATEMPARTGAAQPDDAPPAYFPDTAAEPAPTPMPTGLTAVGP